MGVLKAWALSSAARRMLSAESTSECVMRSNSSATISSSGTRLVRAKLPGAARPVRIMRAWLPKLLMLRQIVKNMPITSTVSRA